MGEEGGSRERKVERKLLNPRTRKPVRFVRTSRKELRNPYYRFNRSELEGARTVESEGNDFFGDKRSLLPKGERCSDKWRSQLAREI